MLIRDKDCQGALPPAGAVDWMLDKTLANAYASFLDPVTVRSRYQVLYDKTVNCNIQGGATNFSTRKAIRINLKRPLKVQYNINNTGTITDIQSGGIYFVMYTDVAANGPAYYFQCMYKFKDS